LNRGVNYSENLRGKPHNKILGKPPNKILKIIAKSRNFIKVKLIKVKLIFELLNELLYNSESKNIYAYQRKRLSHIDNYCRQIFTVETYS
jgi:hypothetical protein